MPIPYSPGNKPWKMKLRKWEVTAFGPDPAHTIEAHYVFNNGDEGLVFRRYEKGEDKSMVVAAFAHGAWTSYKEITNG